MFCTFPLISACFHFIHRFSEQKTSKTKIFYPFCHILPYPSRAIMPYRMLQKALRTRPERGEARRGFSAAAGRILRETNKENRKTPDMSECPKGTSLSGVLFSMSERSGSSGARTLPRRALPSDHNLLKGRPRVWTILVDAGTYKASTGEIAFGEQQFP